MAAAGELMRASEPSVSRRVKLRGCVHGRIKVRYDVVGGGMRRYELVTVVTDGHRIEGRKGLALAFFGNILGFFGNKRATLELFTRVTVVTAVTDGPRWSQVVTVGHRIGEGWVRPWTHPLTGPSIKHQRGAQA